MKRKMTFVFKTFKQYLLMKEDIHDQYEEIHKLEWKISKELGELIEKYGMENDGEYIHMSERQPWSVINKGELDRLYYEYVTYGFIKNEKLLDRCCQLYMTNSFKIKVNTEICGHSELIPEAFDEVLDRYDMEWGDNRVSYIFDYFDDDNGALRISDCLQPLLRISIEMEEEFDVNKKFVLFDRGLNVVHLRSDIASWFVEGGSVSLHDISGEGSED